ncbi:MAG TPA: DNA-3-methyladenine glycosylase 2 family protein [Planctomycetota bacterium]|nr:DNA-3-methyladenine glycosylase 2 family protein [Planctomycetota bacterium]
MDPAIVARAARRFAKADPRFARLIRAVGPLAPHVEREDFANICRIIAGQQLSTRAAATIWGRVHALVGEFTPQAVAALPLDALRASGLSGAKARYVAAAAARVASGEIDLEAVRELDDAAATASLRRLAGFGPWSIEMYLIFVLGRPDVFSPGDGGLRRAIGLLYGERNATPERSAAIAERWRPYRSVACRYLWAWLDAGTPAIPVAAKTTAHARPRLTPPIGLGPR